MSDLARYRRCPSDKILVIFGKTGEGSTSVSTAERLLFGPSFKIILMSILTPIAIDIPLQGALSRENIRIAAPSTFTVESAWEWPS